MRAKRPAILAVLKHKYKKSLKSKIIKIIIKNHHYNTLPQLSFVIFQTWSDKVGLMLWAISLEGRQIDGTNTLSLIVKLIFIL